MAEAQHVVGEALSPDGAVCIIDTLFMPIDCVPKFLIFRLTVPALHQLSAISIPWVSLVKMPEMYMYAIPARAIVISNINNVATIVDIPFMVTYFNFESTLYKCNLMKKILLDTNFLIDLLRFRIGAEELLKILHEPYEIFTLSATVDELKKMAKKRGSASKFAKIALEMIKLEKINTIKVRERDADKAFLNTANKNTIIATNDRGLRKKLKSLGVKTIYLRARKHLEIG